MALLPLTFSVNHSSELPEILWSLAPAATVGMALNSATQRLKEAQIEGAWLDAQVILAHALGVDRAWLFAHGEEELTARQSKRFTDMIARRVAHEPVAYLIGHKEFYGIDLLVDKRVLVPRPETEMLVDEVLVEIESRGATGRSVLIADIGTGSGPIALAVAANAENARIYAVDISKDALKVAKVNARRLDSRKQVTLLRGDLLEPLPERVDIVVANLPYIGNQEYHELEPNVRLYEPKLALTSGDEGLDAIRTLLRQAPAHLKPEAMIYLEIGWMQGKAVAQLAREMFPLARAIAVHQDYQGNDRMVVIAT